MLLLSILLILSIPVNSFDIKSNHYSQVRSARENNLPVSFWEKRRAKN
jgi:hypothetical protein